MKRDMDLIRGILLEIEEKAGISGVQSMHLTNGESELVSCHIEMLIDAQLVTSGNPMATRGGMYWANLKLTWAGHEFLDACRSPKLWDQATEAVAKVGGITLPAWVSLLTQLASKNMGIRLD